jgi:hypothetical protein
LRTPADPRPLEVAEQEALLRQTLPDAHLTLAQEVSRKARHGRWEERILWAIESEDLNQYLGSAGTVGKPWPGVHQALRLERVITSSKTGKTTVEVAHGITSRRAFQTSAGGLLRRWRVHWHIENRQHWVRDVTLGEDASQIAQGQAPKVFAILRTTVVTMLGWSDRPGLAAAQREFAQAPPKVLDLFNDVARRIRRTGKK